MTDDRPLLDCLGAAERLGVPERFARRLVAERRIEFFKIGKYIRFDPRALDAWIDTQRVTPLD